MSSSSSSSSSSSTTSATAATAASTTPVPGSSLTGAERFELFRAVGEECVSEQEMKNLCEKKPNIRCYDGFEPSGRMHIAQGLFKATNVNKCTAAGSTFVFWVADWFALMNDKMGGDLKNIQLVGKYFVEVWKAAGMDMSHVEFQWASEEITRNWNDYWTRVLDIGRRNTVNRIKKCCTIMGRADGSLTAAQVLYPLMQCADIFFLKADVCQLGVDQRKVNMLAREYCDDINRKLKPVILSHHMLAGLVKGQAKMSKSNPDSAVFMEDSREDVARKINNAYCPLTSLSKVETSAVPEDGNVEASDNKNPCLEYIRYVLFSRPGYQFVVPGSQTFDSYEEVEDAFLKEAISEEQLKAALTNSLNELLEPVRQHFSSNTEAKELLNQVKFLRSATSTSSSSSSKQQEGEPEEKKEVENNNNKKNIHGVAWLPCGIKVSLNSILSIVHQLNKFVSSGGENISSSSNKSASLLLSDWTSYSNGSLSTKSELKDIGACLEYHAEIAKALGLNPNVKIVKQSEQLVGTDPNRFWISAITAGRKFRLSEVETLVAPTSATPPVDQAGHVIASLLHCADVDVSGASHIFSLHPSSAGVNRLAALYSTLKQEDADDQEATSSSSAVKVIESFKTVAIPEFLCDPKTKPTSADDYLYADESENDLKRKIKKAFCRPGDPVTPVIDLAAFFISSSDKKMLLIERKDENGGNKEYKTLSELVSDFTSEKLHPGDLKASVSKAVVELFKNVHTCINSSDQKKRAQTMKNLEKKIAKAN